MPKSKKTYLSDVIPAFAPQGANDRRWFIIEHQLEQTVMSASVVVGALRDIAASPENEEEREIATDCLAYAQAMQRHIQEQYSNFLSYVSGMDVLERISRKEL